MCKPSALIKSTFIFLGLNKILISWHYPFHVSRREQSFSDERHRKGDTFLRKGELGIGAKEDDSKKACASSNIFFLPSAYINCKHFIHVIVQYSFHYEEYLQYAITKKSIKCNVILCKIFVIKTGKCIFCVMYSSSSK